MREIAMDNPLSKLVQKLLPTTFDSFYYGFYWSIFCW